jgi:transposase
MRSKIDPEEAVRLYVDKEWSVREIANHLGSSYGRIYNLLRNRVVMRTARDRGKSEDHTEIAEIIKARIVDGDWETGRKILPIADLARIFGVRQQTVRLAIADLRRRGYLRSERGRGICVRPPRRRSAETAEGL